MVAEATLLGDEEAALTVRQNMFLASVNLIEALGGGWDSTLLPTQTELKKGFSLLPQLEPNPLVVAPADAPAAVPPGRARGPAMTWQNAVLGADSSLKLLNYQMNQTMLRPMKPTAV